MLGIDKLIMNRYGNKCGVCTPQMTELNKYKLESATGIQFEDTSWHNDQCDSIGNESLNIQIHLPNSEDENIDQEEYNTYCISSYDGEDAHMQHRDRMYSFEELVLEITTSYKTNKL